MSSSLVLLLISHARTVFDRFLSSFLLPLVHSGRNSMTDGLWGLIGALRRGHSDWSSFDHSRIRAAFLMPGESGVASEIAGV